MKNSKKGISLIVLVITIIVIIILAAAVILTLNQNNPIGRANQAVSDNDKAEAQAALTLLIANVMADKDVENSVEFVAAGPLNTAKLKVSRATDKFIEIDETGDASIVATEADATVLTFGMLGIPKKLFDKLTVNEYGVVSYI